MIYMVYKQYMAQINDSMILTSFSFPLTVALESKSSEVALKVKLDLQFSFVVGNL